MDNLQCSLSNCTPKTGFEGIAIGIITLIIGNIAFYFSLDKNDRRKKKKELPKLSLIFFITGFVLHFIIEYVGLNKWYCDKKCITGIKCLSKL